MKKQDLKTCALPESPGVYFFRDIENNILYIGKATSLYDRVRSYFSPDLIDSRGLRLVSMVVASHTVTFQETASVLEALLLESLLIKKHNPPYNVKEKDNKSFACVVITKEAFPRVLTMRIRDFEKSCTKKDTLIVYGPFASLSSLKDALKIIRKMFPYRDSCEVGCDPLKNKPCFNAQIGLCPGVCTGSIDEKSYRENITNIRRFFEGKKESIQKSLTKEMEMEAKKEHFEKAAKIRNVLFSLDHIKDVSLIKDEDILSFKDNSFRIESFDVAHISGTSRVGVMCVLEGKEKIKSDYRKFKLEEGNDVRGNDDYEGLRVLLRRRFSHSEWRYPDLIVIDGGIAHLHLAQKVLTDMGLLIPIVSVVKDERHKPKDILGQKIYVDNHKTSILLANSEAHRFAITYHKSLRDKLK